jgi:hypothetical protein
LLRDIVHWAVPEDAIPTHGDAANRNDDKYIDNGPTRHASAEQIAAWRILVRVLQALWHPQ